jgi:D-ribulokinase
MVPDAWLNEGGQSAAGAAIERLLTLHPAARDAAAAAEVAGMSLPLWLAEAAVKDSATLSDVARLAEGLHVVPEFLGNRAPVADPHARAVIAGLGMEADAKSLLALYVAGLCSIGYGLRQIIETQAGSGAPVERIMISGGAGQLDLVRQLLADATGKPLVATEAEEPVLLGSAMLGAVAGGLFDTLPAAMAAMSSEKATFAPASGKTRQLHDARFDAFKRLQNAAREIRKPPA